MRTNNFLIAERDAKTSPQQMLGGGGGHWNFEMYGTQPQSVFAWMEFQFGQRDQNSKQCINFMR